MTRKDRARINLFLRYLLLISLGIVMIYPLCWMVGASFKTNSELFASAVFMFFQSFVDIKIPLLVQTVLLAAFVIIAIAAVAGRDATKAIKDDVKTKVAALKGMGVDVEMLASAAQDPELRARLKKLAESIRYSDPMSTPAIEDVEQRIHMTINELRVYCEQGDKPSALEAISRLDLMLVERNKKLMLSK